MKRVLVLVVILSLAGAMSGTVRPQAPATSSGWTLLVSFALIVAALLGIRIAMARRSVADWRTARAAVPVARKAAFGSFGALTFVSFVAMFVALVMVALARA